ncbi:MAG: hypothetical protein OET90_05100 [Desulfuromonadales bacterium]|nr:hypothetical protein [Desulfuromonadales bacterium]
MKISEFCQKLDAKLEGIDDKEKLRLSALTLQQAFKVAEDEVAILKLDRNTESLCFIWPEKLGKSGNLPLKAKDTFAVATVLKNQPQRHNRFESKLHASIFEQVNLQPKPKKKKTQDAEPEIRKPKKIQKIMSAPLLNQSTVTGAIQVCRKADDVAEAGPDFSELELDALAEIAKVIGKHL